MLTARLVNPGEIGQLIKRLEKFIPHSLQAFYLATALESKRWNGIDFYVDTWPNFTALVSKPNKRNYDSPFCKLTKNEHSIFHCDIQNLHTLLLTPGVIEWGSKITWSAIKLKDEVEVLEECAARHNGVIDVDAIQELYVIDAGEVAMESHCTVPDNMICTDLKPHDAVMVAKDWGVDEQSENVEFVSKLIENFPTTCLKTQPTSDVIAYALMYHFGSYGMAYVKPEHRGNRYFTTVAANLIKYAKRKGIMPYPFGFVPKENIAATTQSIQFGGTLIPNSDTAWCFYRPKVAHEVNTTQHGRFHRHNHPHDEELMQRLAKRVL